MQYLSRDPHERSVVSAFVAGPSKRNQFQKKLAGKGWLTLGWPAEHGGLAATHMMQVIYNEEMSYHRAPTQLGVGPDRVGPTIILYGTDNQKQKHLPECRMSLSCVARSRKRQEHARRHVEILEFLFEVLGRREDVAAANSNTRIAR